MKQLFERNYQAVVNRGLIKPETTDLEFLYKLDEESTEAYEEIGEDEQKLTQEITDVLVVCSNWLIHRGVDLEKVLTENAIKNENRAK